MPSTDLRDRRDAALERYLKERAPAGGSGPSAVLRREEARPFSLLAWYDVEAHDPSSIVVKVTRRAKAAGPRRRPRESMQAERVRALLPPHTHGVVVPLRDYEDLDVTITGAVAGVQLAALIDECGRWWPGVRTLATLSDACARAGTWLRQLHDSQPAHPTWSKDELREDLDNRMRRLVDRSREVHMPAPLRERALAWVDRRLADTSDHDIAGGLTHGDFSPSNMLVTARDIHVLDFTMVREAPYLLDVSRFCHQLDMMGLKPAFRPATRATLQQAFLRGYGREELVRSPVVQVFLLRHALTHWLSRAQRVQTPLRDLTRPAFWLCLYHRRRVRALLDGAPLPWDASRR